VEVDSLLGLDGKGQQDSQQEHQALHHPYSEITTPFAVSG
jgi:hypothetical protein